MGNGALAIGPKLPRPSSTLPTQTSHKVSLMSAVRGRADSLCSARAIPSAYRPPRLFAFSSAVRRRGKASRDAREVTGFRSDVICVPADVAECSDEKIRKQCELTAGTKRPLGIKFAGRWMVGKSELLDDLEQGKIDRRRGPHVRQRAEERARKYEGWARPQEPLALPERAAG